MEDIEIWKDVPWYEWHYQASNLWRIKNYKWFIKKWRYDKDKYFQIWLCIRWNKKTYKIHRIILSSFIENIHNKPQINHKDWNKLNNLLENLEWCTSSENLFHKYRILKCKPFNWKDHPLLWKIWKLCKNSKKVDQFSLDWKFIRTWDSMSDIHRELSIFSSWISWCCKWKVKTAWWFIWKYFIY